MTLPLSPSLPLQPPARTRQGSPAAKPGVKTSPPAPVRASAGALDPLVWIGKAIASGHEAALPGQMPAYATLAPAVREAAIRRGTGRVMPQPLTGEKTGPGNADPINLVVTGSLASLKATLSRAGWSQADAASVVSDTRMGLSVLFKLGRYNAAPVSAQYLAGNAAVAAFSKNSDFNRGRDHLRVFALAPDPVSGVARWGIAATRDTAVSLKVSHRPWQGQAVSMGHDSDPHIDAERDLVMADLLGTGTVKQWAAVSGKRAPGLDQPASEGVKIADRFLSDGRVYDVVLK